MITLQARDFSQRKELENKVKTLVTLTPEFKSDIEIKGTRVELERLQLSDETMFYGISCIITDLPTLIKTQKEIEKPQRGEIKPFGINNNLK